jgi:hypothetical protein
MFLKNWLPTQALNATLFKFFYFMFSFFAVLWAGGSVLFCAAGF